MASEQDRPLNVIEHISHDDNLIVVKADLELSLSWQDDLLRQGDWSAIVEGSRETEGGFLIEPPNPNLWQINVGGYMVSDQPAIGNHSSKTYVIYFDSKEYAQRLGQRALSLWAPEYLDKQERDKNARIRSLVKNNKALTDEIERLYLRLGRALSR